VNGQADQSTLFMLLIEVWH